MAVYVYDPERDMMVDKITRLPMLDQVERNAPLQAPQVIPDTPGYRSPVDGSWIEGRRARRYDLEKNNCVDANDLPRKTDGKLKNERFAKKHGLQGLLQR